MTCSFCGLAFDPAEADTACDGCPLTPNCHLVRCPRCGYEMPPEAGLTKWLRKVRRQLGGERKV